TDIAIGRHLLPFVPPLVLVTFIHLCAANIPIGGEWDLVPIVAQLAAKPFTWAALVSERLGLAKMVTTWLTLMTNFNLTYVMYFGFCLQFFAFILLFSVLELTLRAWHKRLIPALAVTIALIMFSLSYDHTWLSGLKSLEAGITTLAAAAIYWLLTR